MKESFIDHYCIVNDHGHIHPDYPIGEKEIMQIAHNLESWGDKVIVFKVIIAINLFDTTNDVARICQRKEIYRTEGFKLQEEK